MSASVPNFVLRRPTIPTGTTVGALPPIQRVLHADDACEVYLLEQGAGGSKLLLLLPERVEPRATVEPRLTRFFAAQGPERVTLDRFLPESESPLGSILVSLAVRGRWLAEEQQRRVDDEREVVELTGALCSLAEASLGAGAIPVFSPSLLFAGPGAMGMNASSVLALAATPTDEARAVRELAGIVYWRASGVDLGQAKRLSPPPLSKWCIKVGPQVSSVIGRCLEPDHVGSRITSIEGLRNGLMSTGQPMSALGRTSRPVGKEAPAATDATAKGLAKVAGMSELKSLLMKEVVRPILDPEPFRRYGLSIPNGILLYGPPGCGKTWIARALAEEVGHYFVEIIPSEIGSPWIHDSVLRIRELFDTAAEKAPSILFIDEFDAMVPKRAELGGHQQYKAEEVNEFLTHLNACADKKIFVIAATNEPSKIDQAILRTGRLDKLIYVGPPDPEARMEMLKIHLARRPTKDLDLLSLAPIAANLAGYAASDLKFLVDEAARDALDANSPIAPVHLERAAKRIPPSVKKEDEKRFKVFQGRG